MHLWYHCGSSLAYVILVAALLQALERKRAAVELRRAEEARAMEEYNAMVEAQDRAHREALSGVNARQV
jgi:Mg2+/citrate symporter